MIRHHYRKHKRHIKSLLLIVLSVVFISCGLMALWVATLPIPDLSSFTSRQVVESTKIYDRTGTILLYDTGANIKRKTVTLSEISPYIQQATIAIEDSNFYHNSGIEPLSIIRAFLANISTGGYNQGASTITQQVIKNSLLTQDKTITRKIKELVLAIKLTQVMTKDQILQAYFNETPYGGTTYGIEEASQIFFGKPAKNVTIAEAAYLAAIPQAPSYYSPNGLHKSALDAREKTVLSRMKSLGMISDKEYQAALKEKVIFSSRSAGSIRAPHFVMYVKDYLTQKYGEDVVLNGGLKVITSLDYDMQKKAEDVVTKFSASLSENYNASNTAVVAIDPKTGDILTMVGSKDYFDESIDGNYNVALANRQPGSTFKPFVYTTLFEKGYTPETVLFDAETEFSTECTVDGRPKNPALAPDLLFNNLTGFWENPSGAYSSSTPCYSPGEYDNIFEGPLTVRQALAQSRNIPAVKALYLAGIGDSLQTAQEMGITTLSDPNRYGLTLVLGGGEVSLLDITSAYGVFADDGVRNPYRSVLEVDDSKGNVLEKATLNPSQVVPAEAVRQISSILSDTNVRMASLKPIGESVGRTVAIKTGTTNDYRDVWTLGYTPDLVVGAWAGNNDNTPMQHNVAGLIISPLWGAFMSQVAKNFPPSNFVAPPQPYTSGKPVLHGVWQGGISYWVDTISGKVATPYTPVETKKEVVFNNVHSILYWLNKDDPRGLAPIDPTKDSQFQYWEYGVRNWFTNYVKSHPDFRETVPTPIPTATDDVHTPEKSPQISIVSPIEGSTIDPQLPLSIQIRSNNVYQITKTDVYINGKYVLTSTQSPLNISFVPADVTDLSADNVLSVTVYDGVYNKGQASLNFHVAQTQ
ncbi:MAG: transglycosylase domain-containing protein [Candidatus Taylorbacteria bacterium]